MYDCPIWFDAIHQCSPGGTFGSNCFSPLLHMIIIIDFTKLLHVYIIPKYWFVLSIQACFDLLYSFSLFSILSPLVPSYDIPYFHWSSHMAYINITFNTHHIQHQCSYMIQSHFIQIYVTNKLMNSSPLNFHRIQI